MTSQTSKISQADRLLRLDARQVARELATGLAMSSPGHRRLLATVTAHPALARHVGGGATSALQQQWTSLRSRGWQPHLLRHVARTRHVAVEALLAGRPGSAPLADRLLLLHDLHGLPDLPTGVDPSELDPSVVDAARDPAGAAEAKMLARVRALLAKAEATEFPEEAEALSAKAQQLVSRHSLQQALADPGDDRPAVVHLTHDAPYAEAKAHLLAAVAAANRCRAVMPGPLGISTVMGFRADLRAAELLYASLLVQATHALAGQGRLSAEARGRGFRRAFYLAYAGRIGARLSESRTATEQAHAAGGSGELVPVLARRGAAVDALVAQQFPRLRTARTTVSNERGYRAGLAAADLADLAALGEVARR